MRTVSMFFLLILIFTMVHAAENDGAPPIPPEGNEKAVFVKTILSNGSSARLMPIVLLVREGNESTVYRLITDGSGVVILPLGEGEFELDALLDDFSTSGIDYAATAAVDTNKSGNATLIFYPSGSISGRALFEGSPMPGAHVHVSCPSNSFDYERINGGSQAISGEAGEFLFRALPTGACIVSASTDSLAGSENAEVLQGKAASVDIILSRKARDEPQQSFDLNFAFMALAILFATLLAAYLFTRKKPTQESRAQISQEKEARERTHSQKKTATRKAESQAAHEETSGKYDSSSPRAKAVLATLSEREREIVKFLFKNNGRAKRSAIQHKLLIPKTSLLRNLRSLERKNIVKLTPFGRNLLAEIEDSLFE